MWRAVCHEGSATKTLRGGRMVSGGLDGEGKSDPISRLVNLSAASEATWRRGHAKGDTATLLLPTTAYDGWKTTHE